MSVYGVSYSVAQDNIVSIYNKFEKIVTVNGLTDKLFGISNDVPMDKDDGLGYFEPEGSTEPVSVMQYMLENTAIGSFINEYNIYISEQEDRYDIDVPDIAYSNFSISPNLYKITIDSVEYKAFRVDCNYKSLAGVVNGDFYMEVTGKGFPNWYFFKTTYYPLLYKTNNNAIFPLNVMRYCNSFSDITNHYCNFKTFVETNETVREYVIANY